MTLEKWLNKMRNQNLMVMISFLVLVVSILLAITSLFILSISLKFFIYTFLTVLILGIVFIAIYFPALKLENKLQAIYNQSQKVFIETKTTVEIVEEEFVRTQKTFHGITYIKKNHEPIHQAFVEAVREEKVTLYPFGSYLKDDVCEILQTTLKYTLVLYKTERILVSTKAIILS